MRTSDRNNAINNNLGDKNVVVYILHGDKPATLSPESI
jgi:hypothetical protein